MSNRNNFSETSLQIEIYLDCWNQHFSVEKYYNGMNVQPALGHSNYKDITEDEFSKLPLMFQKIFPSPLICCLPQ